MSTSHWISHRNTITAGDLTRMRRTFKALGGGIDGESHQSHHTPKTRSRGSSADTDTIAGGGSRRRASPPSPPCRSTQYRVFYRVDKSGRKSGSTKYELADNTLKPLAEELMESALRAATKHAAPLLNVPLSVQQAVDDAVQHRMVTPQQGTAFIKKFQRYGRATEHATIYLREQGKRSIKEFEGCYRMLKHPSHMDVLNGRVRRMAVEYVGAFRA